MPKNVTPNSSVQSKRFWNEYYDSGGVGTKRKRPATDIFEAVDAVYLDTSHASILDFGCGPGRWAEYWQGRGLKYDGYDASQSAVERAQLNRHSYLFTSDIADLATTYDVIFTCTVMIHNADLAPIIEWFANHVSAGSRIITIESVWDEEEAEAKKKHHKELHTNQFVWHRTREEYLAAWPSTFNLVHEDQFRKNITCFAWDVS